VGVLVGQIITCLNGAPRVQRKNGLDALDALVKQHERLQRHSDRGWQLTEHQAAELDDAIAEIKRLKEQLEATRAALEHVGSLIPPAIRNGNANYLSDVKRDAMRETVRLGLAGSYPASSPKEGT